MSPILMKVSRVQAGWRLHYGEVALEYASWDEAVAAAFVRAKRLAKGGQVVAVVMSVITSVYGPGGFIRTIPTRRKTGQVPRLPGDAYEELLASSAAPSLPTTEVHRISLN